MKRIIGLVIFNISLCGMLYAQSPTTFSFTGAAQTYTVPVCVYSVKFDVRGAAGTPIGTNFSAPGKGGKVTGTLKVQPGQVLNIYVGGAGVGVTGGWNGGGNAGSLAGAGGGGSDIRVGGVGLNDRMIIAGGGGGGGADDNHVYVNTGGKGGDLIAGDGVGNSGNLQAVAGLGGNQDEGGKGGGNLDIGTPGQLGIGGNGGTQAGAGGGGGGGFYGGGGGGTSQIAIFGGGGGGGSSYTDSKLTTDVLHFIASQAGNGQIIITANAPGQVKADSIMVPDSVCNNSIVDFMVDSVVGAESYSWNVPSNATILEGAGTNQIKVQFGTEFGFVSVNAVNECGTSDTTFKLIEKCAGGGGGTGLGSNNRNTNYSIYPNPNQGKIYFNGNLNLEIKSISIINVYGQRVWEKSYAGFIPNEINLENLPFGIYNLIVQTKEGEKISKKIIIQKN